jgi:hypothetical protein
VVSPSNVHSSAQLKTALTAYSDRASDRLDVGFIDEDLPSLKKKQTGDE